MSSFPIIGHRIKNIALFSGIYLALVSLFAYIIFILINSTGTRTEFDGAIGADFLAFYTGGTFYNLGILEQAYNLAPDFYFPQQAEFQKKLIGEDLKKFYYFINPPYAALIYAPFAKLAYLPAFILWQIFNFCLLVFSVIIARRELTILQKLPIYKIVGCCFLFYPTLGWVIFGQATPIVLLLYCLCYTSLRKRQEYRAGIYLGLLAFKPQLAIVIALVLLFKWRWRSLIGGGLSVSMSMALGYILAPDAMLAYIEISPQLIDLLRLPNYPTWGVHSFFGFSVLLFEELNPLFAILSTYVLSGGTILLLWLRIPGHPATHTGVSGHP